MQFITTGNRIAVENFTLGDLYTITFTNGTYINSACIGIGENFVSFQRNDPELIFSLTMETAELVSSIDLYAGGTGTNNYNDLTNKPQINDVELVGNKSLSDFGIQPTISDIDTIRSGAAAGATAVQPAALADYQPIISDLDTIRSGAAAGATAVQPAALADYQPKIDSSHKLDADLVDDTSSANKFATAAQLSQIGINENNISFNANNGVKNSFNIKTVTNISSSLSISGDVVTMTTDDSRTNLRMMVQRYNDSTLLSTVFLEEITTNGIIAINFTKDATFNTLAIGHNGSSVDGKFRTSVANLQNGTEYTLVINVLECMKNPHFQWGYIMICPKPLYDNDSSYQPYAMSNAELTAAIQALQAQLANQ